MSVNVSAFRSTIWRKILLQDTAFPIFNLEENFILEMTTFTDASMRCQVWMAGNFIFVLAEDIEDRMTVTVQLEEAETFGVFFAFCLFAPKLWMNSWFWHSLCTCVLIIDIIFEGKFPQTTMWIGWVESNFTNPTVKVWADFDNPFKRSDYAMLCMSPSLDRTLPEYVIYHKRTTLHWLCT